MGVAGDASAGRREPAERSERGEETKEPAKMHRHSTNTDTASDCLQRRWDGMGGEGKVIVVSVVDVSTYTNMGR